MNNSQISKYRYFDIISILFVASLLSTNIVAVKIIQVGLVIVPAGTIVFPISYIINDVLTEVYGLKISKTRNSAWIHGESILGDSNSDCSVATRSTFLGWSSCF
jgi:hypothetical protein